MIDFQAGEPQFVDHLAPIYLALPERQRGAFATPSSLRGRLASWGIAFIEYCLAVPANRIGSAVYSTAELKTMQEVITLCVFLGFSWLFLREPLSWNHYLGFALIAAGAAVVFLGKAPPA